MLKIKRSKIGLDIKDRLLESRSIDESTGCWNWLKHKNCCGYGVIGINRKSNLVHRVAYTAFVGIIPSHIFVLHKCDNPSCFNPDHLFMGTQLDNMTDMMNKNRGGVGESASGSKLNEIDVKSIFAMLSQGKNCAEISRLFRVDYKTVYAIANRESWRHVADKIGSAAAPYIAHNFGSKHFMSKLTEASVTKILSSPLPTKMLAQQYSVSTSTILLIKNGKTWAHLARPDSIESYNGCKKGHPYVEGSFYMRHGSKICRVCMRARYDKSRAKL